MDIQDVPAALAEYSEHARTMALGAAGCAAVLLSVTAWSKWGYPRWGKFMEARQREQEHLKLMVKNMVGALEYMVSDNTMTPHEMWKLIPKFDHIPGFRDLSRDMLKKYLPKGEEPKKTKLSSLSLT